jgi:hypothetical protein
LRIGPSVTAADSWRAVASASSRWSLLSAIANITRVRLRIGGKRWRRQKSDGTDQENPASEMQYSGAQAKIL